MHTTHLRNAMLAALIGVGVLVTIAFSGGSRFGGHVAAYAALTALAVFTLCLVLQMLFDDLIEGRQKVPWQFTIAISPILGVAIGLGFVSFVSQSFDLTRLKLSTYGAIGVAASFSVPFGMVLYSLEVIQRRFRRNVERIKEAEFAEKELELARSIQQRLLPPAAIDGDGFRISACNLPARIVAGDFYDVFHLADGTIGLVIADVSGKGIAASLIMASVKGVVPLVASSHSAAETLTQLNRKLSAELPARDFVALCFARFDPRDGTIEIANAGLPDPYRISPTNAVEALSAPGPRLPLGAMRQVVYQSLRTKVDQRERFLFVTDGLPEAPNAAGEPLGYEALARSVSTAAASDDLVARLIESVRAASPGALQDDWTILLLERR